MPSIHLLAPGHPLRSSQGFVGFCTTVLIEGTQRILVDAGHVGRRGVVVEALAERGLSPEDIDVTVLTHAHWDHAQNQDLFPHAPTLVHGWELRYARDPHPNDLATPRWTGAMLDAQANVREVEDGHVIEPGVRILHTPGHSAGSITVLVDTDDGVAAVTGDVLHYATIALSKRNPLVFWSEESARRSIERCLEAADVFYPGHDRPFRVVGSDSFEYLEPLDLVLAGLAPEDEGLRWDTSPRRPWVMPGIEQQGLPGVAPVAGEAAGARRR